MEEKMERKSLREGTAQEAGQGTAQEAGRGTAQEVSQAAPRQENKMGVMPVKQLIVSMSLPMMVSMLVQALYNVVDSIFVAQLSENALTAVTLAFPMQNLMIAVGSGTGVGVNALLSKALGEKRFDRSDGAANMGLLLTFFNYVLFVVMGLLLAGPFISTQTADPEIAAYSVTYLRIVTCLSAGVFCQMMFERLLQATGRTFLSMISQATGAIINIIFDPIMIFGLFGFPKLGVAGAAYATVLGQCVAAVIGLVLNRVYNTDIRLSLRGILRPDREIISRIYAVGVPSILMMSIGSIMTYAMNRILIVFSTTATAVFGVYFKLQSFFFMPVFGMNNGLIPVLAFNYGARNRKRIEEALRFAMMLAVSIMLVGTVVFELFPGQLLSLFNASPEMKEIGIPALRIICLCFPIAGVCIALGSVFQAFSKSVYSLIISVGRQLGVLIPAAWILARIGGLPAIWWSFVLAEGLSLVLSVILFRKLYRDTIETL